MPFKQGNPHRFKPGVSGNPAGGKPQTLAREIDKLAKATGAHKLAAEMVIAGILTMRIPLDTIIEHCKTLDVVPVQLARLRRLAVDGARVELDAGQWASLVRTWMPPPPQVEGETDRNLEDFLAELAPKVAEFAAKRAARK